MKIPLHLDWWVYVGQGLNLDVWLWCGKLHSQYKKCEPQLCYVKKFNSNQYIRVWNYFQPVVSRTLSQEPDWPAGFCCTFSRRRSATPSPKMVWSQVLKTTGNPLSLFQHIFVFYLIVKSVTFFLILVLLWLCRKILSWYPVVLWSPPSCCFSEQHSCWSSICCPQSCLYAG